VPDEEAKLRRNPREAFAFLPAVIRLLLSTVILSHPKPPLIDEVFTLSLASLGLETSRLSCSSQARCKLNHRPDHSALLIKKLCSARRGKIEIDFSGLIRDNVALC
jgi:hypothetical protein